MLNRNIERISNCLLWGIFNLDNCRREVWDEYEIILPGFL